MSDRNRDSHPDSMPSGNHDVRVDVTQGTAGANNDIENIEGGTGGATSGEETPLEPAGVPDGVAGTGGVTKNQDDTAQ